MDWQMDWQKRKQSGKRKYAGKRYRSNEASSEDHEEDPGGTRPIQPGTITSVETQRKNAKRISIFVNGRFAFGLHQDVLLQHALHSGMELDEPKILELVAADALLRAKETAIVYLGHRARTEFEVRKKLKDKGFDPDITEQVIQRLYELSYLNDEQFAASYVRGRFRQKGYGPQRLKSELYRLGIEGSLIENTLQEVLGAEDILARALQEAQKRLKRLRSETDPSKKRRKLFDFLMRRGHTADTARAVLEELDLNT